ncbi:MAG: glycyl-radical enzyme activating protein [Chloroflexi bacterium]|nr:glycyl-radical enzyme activating protein [Chloroflexota bacterium]
MVHGLWLRRRPSQKPETPNTGPTGLVFDVQRYSVHDGPGIRTTVFLKGCPLRCLWCHNPESQLRDAEVWLDASRCINCGDCVPVCPVGAHTLRDGVHQLDRSRCRYCGRCVDVCDAGALENVGRPLSVGAAVAAVEQDRPFYARSGGGVTLSGGEPLLQPAFAAAFLAACRRRGLHTALETCGQSTWRVLERVAREADLVLYDVKHTDAKRHRALTGAPNERILSNLRQLLAAGAKVIVRVPVVPGCNDGDEHFRALAAFLRSCSPLPAAVELLPYHGWGEAKYRRLDRPYSLAECRTPDRERCAAIRDLVAESRVPVRLPDS